MTRETLTGRWRFRTPRIGRKPVLEVQVSWRRLKSMYCAPGEDNMVTVTAWRDATLQDLLSPALIGNMIKGGMV
jgi:hypothetical protein